MVTARRTDDESGAPAPAAASVRECDTISCAISAQFPSNTVQ